MKLRVFIMSLMLLCDVQCSFAVEASRRAAAEKLMVETGTEEVFKNSQNDAVKRFRDMIYNEIKGNEDKKKADRFFTKVFEIARKEFEWQNIKEEVITVYAETYSENELVEMTRFFSSPIGKKFITTSLILNDKLRAVLANRIQNCLPQLREVAEEMEKK